MRLKRMCAVWGLALVTSAAANGVAFAEPVQTGQSVRALDIYSLTLADVHGDERHLSDYEGRWVAIMFLNKDTGDIAAQWARAIREIRSEENALPIFRVLQLGTLPRLLRGVARGRLKDGWNEGHGLYVDWQNRYAGTLGIEPTVMHVYLIRPDGTIADMYTNAPDEPQLARLRERYIPPTPPADDVAPADGQPAE